MFKIFSDIIFLVLLIGIFDKFISEVGSDIFGKLDNPDFNVSDMLSKVSSQIIKLANFTNKISKRAVKDTVASGIETKKQYDDDKIKREIYSQYYDKNKNNLVEKDEPSGGTNE